MATATSMVEFRRVTVRLGEKRVFRETDWTLRRGEHWAVIGPTGAGKTVFCRTLRGELPVVEGAVAYRFRPHPGREPEARIERLSSEPWTFHTAEGAPARWFSLDRECSPRAADLLSRDAVEEVHRFEVVRRPPSEARRWERRVRRIIRDLAIEPLLGKPLLALSNGEQRKIALARSLLRRPRILILDDPFAGLDARFRRHFRLVLERLMRRDSPAIVLAGAEPGDLPRGLTHAVVIDRLRVIAHGPLHSLRRDPRAAPFLGAPSSRRGDAERAPVTAHPRAGPARELVVFRNVQARWGDAVILRDVNWTVREGESWAVTGPNGSGKTTLLSYILGDNPQLYANDIRLFGRARGSGESLWDIQRRIGWVSPELHHSADPSLTGLETVLTGFRDGSVLREHPSPRHRAEASRWLRRLHLSALAGRPFGDLSAGEQRMLLLARALVKSPGILILDEPCHGLDRPRREAFLAMVDRLARRGTTVLLVTHRAEEIPPSIFRVLRLRNGRAFAGLRRPPAPPLIPRRRKVCYPPAR